MLDQYERWVHFYTLTLQSIPLHAPPFTLIECIELLRKKTNDGKCFNLIERQTACVRITDLKINDDATLATFLFQYSDSKVSDPAFSDLQSGETREEPKLDGEGIAVSAHAVLRLNPLPGRQVEFLFLLEDAPGVGKTKILPFLNKEIKALLARDFVDPDDNKRKACHPHFDLGHHISQTLREDLEKGELRFIEFVKDFNVAELDEDPYLKRLSNTVKVKVAPKTYGDEAISAINKVKNFFNKNGFDHMKVIYKRPEGKQRSVDLSTFREDVGMLFLERWKPSRLRRNCRNVLTKLMMRLF
ncbi:hypothetical protein PHLH8_56630 [Pseudomonas sp. Pc102]|uniref:hypothetical protein n=1 Tax=Pseudomonas sp. Pc102 TaxID=2678261 RepID=UPI001BD1319B|nr:hypothetical protein [Pseudomonas sp. Pc102]BBP86021.1 hypothetical protein PHLH8_56630 [Pseudomonas sp. Pc102]